MFSVVICALAAVAGAIASGPQTPVAPNNGPRLDTHVATAGLQVQAA